MLEQVATELAKEALHERAGPAGKIPTFSEDSLRSAGAEVPEAGRLETTDPVASKIPDFSEADGRRASHDEGSADADGTEERTSRVEGAESRERLLEDNQEEVPEGGMPDEEVSEAAPRGGAYKDLPSEPGCEKHHCPANSTTDLPKGDGPAIVMDAEDHRQTASCGQSKEAREYREAQSELVQQGKLKEAQQMDIDDIRSKFGDKYDEQIAQMQAYTDELPSEERS